MASVRPEAGRLIEHGPLGIAGKRDAEYHELAQIGALPFIPFTVKGKLMFIPALENTNTLPTPGVITES